MLQMLAQLQQSPPPSGEEEALNQATMVLSFAMSRIQMRSSKAAGMLADAISKIQKAKDAMKEAGSGPVGQPPDMGYAGSAMGGVGQMSNLGF